jgi:hypothetical protein
MHVPVGSRSDYIKDCLKWTGICIWLYYIYHIRDIDEEVGKDFFPQTDTLEWEFTWNYYWNESLLEITNIT